MSVHVSVSVTPSAVPAQGWLVQYRIKGSTGAYTVPNNPAPPYFISPFSFTTPDAPGTLYEVQVQADCGSLNSTWFTGYTTCNCAQAGGGVGGYAPTADGNQCVSIASNPATGVGNTCLIKTITTNMGNAAFSVYGARIYFPGFTVDDVFWLFNNSTSKIDTTLPTSSYPFWGNDASNTSDGPMNQYAFWRDVDCDSVRDNAGTSSPFTLDWQWTNNSSTLKQVYVAVGCKSNFILKVNGTTLVDTTTEGASGDYITYPWKIWHIMPAAVIQGKNYFNVTIIGTGAGGASDDAAGIAMYNATTAQLKAVTTQAAADALAIFDSRRNVIEGHVSYPVCSCPEGTTLDGSQYSFPDSTPSKAVCVGTLFDICNGTTGPPPISVTFNTSANTLPCGSNTSGYNEFDMIVHNAAPGATTQVTVQLTIGGYINWTGNGGKDLIYAASIDLPNTPAADISGTVPYNSTNGLTPSPPGASVVVTVPSTGTLHMTINSHVDSGGSNFNGGMRVTAINGIAYDNTYNFCVGWGS